MPEQAKPVAAKPRLGRGLSSLIINSVEAAAKAPISLPANPVAVPLATSPVGDGKPLQVAVDKITPNPFQPRREFDPDDLRDLSASIAAQGILQPLIVALRADGNSDEYVLIAGERRLRAARQAGLGEVPCVVRQASRQQMLEWALIENIQRSDLNPVERATAYRQYMDRFQLSAADAAEKLGQPRTTIANYLRILDLCDEIQVMLVNGTLSFGHAKVLASLAGDVAGQLELARKVLAQTLSVRQLEQIVAARSTGDSDQPAEARPIRIKAAYLRDLEEQLARAVGTKVFVQPGRAKNTGRIVIEYYSLDDFDRLCGAMGLSVEG